MIEKLRMFRIEAGVSGGMGAAGGGRRRANGDYRMAAAAPPSGPGTGIARRQDRGALSGRRRR
jgi:hypothetical protein